MKKFLCALLFVFSFCVTASAMPKNEPIQVGTPKPTATPSASAEPTASPSAEPTAPPSAELTVSPSAEPTAPSSAEPTASPSAEPTAPPSAEPAAPPSAEPTASPSAEPTASPGATTQTIKAFANGWELYFKTPAILIDSVTMIPLEEYLQAMWMTNNTKHIDGKIDIYGNGKLVSFLENGPKAFVDGKEYTLTVPPQRIGGVIYVPYRFLVEGLGGRMTAKKIDGVWNIDAILGYTKNIEKESRVLSIESKTDYLIWISKSDFETNVFVKLNDKWRHFTTFACSIGAPSTPTITGEFEYFSKEEKWFYPKYYVAPIMRFYRGYALHSTLIKYNGTPYDSRLGKKISLGCIRHKPEDINWMAENIPLYTKIYITE